uniref:Phage-Barnase-EndoU-ColicinE5/D-RelE like nuclease 2 domain-containing protein n=1 Tax=Candidatus Kentrum sp. FM TaxID=2126340 RepID=A0A450RWL4_9GAMM|nr:MAG: hypothetical protein BECKFM1743A_GA0114220_100106 [Candidatus Kentron sp. FM]VFJ44366.1 MAG: hypothetical protein BECKFM1743C_GA0114222_100106 [Candidatus Kentron sp. FM]VFK06240.1 MAG: hypothetical protein BECKFM1743B_GA0114221_100136 [Candidatus Kentron sp. FM]
MNVVHSVNNVPIRFPRERWFHIVENHNDLAGYYDDMLRTVEEPDLVLRGYNASCIAIRGYGQRGYLQVVYRELSKDDGFIITAYFSNKINRKQIIWRP